MKQPRPAKHRPISDSSHEWDWEPQDKYQYCLECLVVRRADRKNLKCRGPVKISVRDETPNASMPTKEVKDE